MPERGKHADPGVRGSSPSSQHLDHSGSTDYEQFERWDIDARPYPPDLPQTPSPPSSPESITIIGNEAHVPGSFLRRQYMEEGGWISWANSPPRPIPALHGPLSLPYARCPSGAEGTVINGDDLSHKIWGLGTDDCQTGPRPRLSATQARPSVDSNATPPLQVTKSAEVSRESAIISRQTERDAVIDLSRPSTFYGNVCYRPNPSLHLSELYSSKNRFPAPSPRYVDSPNTASVVPNRVALPPRLGLGLGWEIQPFQSASDVVTGGRENTSDRLNTAAPIFVPAAPLTTVPSRGAYIRKVNEPEFQVPFRLSALDIAQQYRAKQETISHTPSSTSSAQWSPTSPHEIPKLMINQNPRAPTVQYIPKIYSPLLDVDDYSAKLRAMLQQIGSREEGIASHEKAPLQASIFQIPAVSQYAPVPAKKTLYSDFSNKRHDDLVSALHVDRAVISFDETAHEEQSNIDNKQISTERRRNLSHQQPRSIPLARLIQRRLSSVAEEDAANRNVYPTLHRTVQDKHMLRPRYQTANSQASDQQMTVEEAFSPRTQVDQDNTQDMSRAASPITSVCTNAVVKLPRQTTKSRSDL